MVRALVFLPGWMPGGSAVAHNGPVHAVFPAGSDQLQPVHGSDRIRSTGCPPPAAAPRLPPKVRCDAPTARCIAAALLPGRRGIGSGPCCGWHPVWPSRHCCRGKHPPCPCSCAGQAAGRSQTLYHGCAHSKGRLSAWGTSFGKIATPPAHRQKREKGCVSFSGLAGWMAQAEGLAPSSRGFGDRCSALSYAYKKCPVSQPGAGLKPDKGTLYTAARSPNRAGPMLLRGIAMNKATGTLSPATQKPQGGFPFLTAFDSIIIPLLQGAFEGQKKRRPSRATSPTWSAYLQYA